MIGVLLSLVPALLPGTDLPPATSGLHVDARTGDDSVADGSIERPFRSLTAALALARAAGDAAPTLHVGLGTYGPDTGEKFPLDLSGGGWVLGMGSSLTILDGGGTVESIVRVANTTHRPATISGVSLRNGTTGFVIAADPIAGGDPQTRRVTLQDVQCESVQVGGALILGADDAPCPLEIHLDGLRAAGCDVGLAVQGVGALALDMVESEFTNCRIGVSLATNLGEDLSEPRAREDPPGEVVQHEITARDCRFVACKEAGVLRVGRNGENRGKPYTFSGCQFLENRIGIDFRRPCGDSALTITGSRFLANTHFGLKLAGNIGPPDRATVVEDSLFRWNGVGLHVINSQLPFHVRRCRVLDNMGVGIFLANFLSDPTTAYVTNSLIAHNGAVGLYCLADSRLLTIHAVHDTIVGNAAAGIKDHRRHAGTSEYEIRHCILAGNLPDLEGLNATQVRGSFVADGSATGLGGNLIGDPCFVAPASRDYRLRADSPCLDLGSEKKEPGLGEHDVLGRPRRVGLPDLGAIERQTTDG